MSIGAIYKDLKAKLSASEVQIDRLADDFQLAFSSPAGRRVLAYLLEVELGLFATSEKPEDVVRRNLAIRILQLMGTFDGVNTSRAVDALVKMPIQRGE